MRNLLWLACVAVAAKGANSYVDAALGGGGTRLLLEKVSPRNQDEVSKHKTESADVEHAELADARKGGESGDPFEDAPQTTTSEAAAFDTENIERIAGEGEALSGSTTRDVAAKMIKSRLATQTTRPAFEQQRRLDESPPNTDVGGAEASACLSNGGDCASCCGGCQRVTKDDGISGSAFYGYGESIDFSGYGECVCLEDLFENTLNEIFLTKFNDCASVRRAGLALLRISGGEGGDALHADSTGGYGNLYGETGDDFLGQKNSRDQTKACAQEIARA